MLRPGPIGREQLEVTLGRKVHSATAHLDKQSQISPGLLKKHYSPAVDVDLLPHGFSDLPPEITSGQAMVFFQRPKHITGDEDYDLFWLTEDGDPTVAAQNLFALLRKLDSTLGYGLNRRLRKGDRLGGLVFRVSGEAVELGGLFFRVSGITSLAA